LYFWCPLFLLDEYKKEFQGDNVYFEAVEQSPDSLSRLETLFDRLSRFYSDNSTTRFMRKQWLLMEKNKPHRYVLSMSLLLLFGNTKTLRTISRWLDLKLVRDKTYTELFETYKPDLVLLPSNSSYINRLFLRQAKQKHIPSISMVDAGDHGTLSRHPFRILPDKLVVPNVLTKQEAIAYADMLAEDVYVSGMPHFDHYVTTKRKSRSEFCKRFSINPAKKNHSFYLCWQCHRVASARHARQRNS